MESSPPVAVVAVPFPAQGHLNALLHLSLQLASRGLPVHYAAPAEHARQARARVHGWGDAADAVRFHELPIPAYATPPPAAAPGGGGAAAFPSHLMPMWEAFTAGAPAPLAELLAQLSATHRRVVVLYDLANAFAAEAAARLHNGEGYALVCTPLTGGRGMVITGWAPQLEILAHGATAAFLSHCGWNSTIESMSHGKPILAWPMHSDQPLNAELVCKHLEGGVLVRPVEKQREVIPRATIQEVIEKMMVSDEGRKIQQRAMEIGEAVRSSAAVGGASRKDLDDFIAHITR
ncbi:unnamed protein product [Urochloa humidicola]